MSEVFSIQLHNRQLYEQGRDGVWLDLPTTTEKLQAALREIGISTDNPQDFFINGYSYPEGQRLALPYEMVLHADVDELNFLAARLETLDAAALAELNAALQNPKGGFENVGQIIDYADNVDYFVHLPDVQTPADLGDYYLNRSGMVDMPEEWKGGIDPARFGQHVARQEQGAFTEYGYLVPSGDEWRRVHEGQPVPEEYRVMAYPAPDVLREETKNRPAPEQTTAEAPPPVVPIILNGQNSADRMKEITDRLETGIQELFESERYKAYLTSMSRFHSYSFNNTLLIAMQGGQLVAGYNKWRDEFQRIVKKGEKGIKILAPAPFKTKKEVPKLDELGRQVIGRDGKPVTETKEVQIPAFKIVSVFDVSQTEGEPLPSIGADELAGSVEDYQDFFKALEQAAPVPIGFEDIPGASHGYYHLTEKRIAIQGSMSELQTLKTAIHEIAHAKLHAIDPEAPAKEQGDRPDSRTREVQAESVAYAVCQHYGLDTSDYSFGYVAGWSSGRELKELKASLETIRATAHELITAIDGHLAELQQQRQVQQTTEQSEPTPAQRAAEQPDPDSVFSKLPPEQQQAMTEEVRAMLQSLVDADLKNQGEVSQGTLEAIQTQGFVLSGDGKLEKAPEPQETKAPAPDPAAEPVVTILWSESDKLKDGQQMPLSSADALFKSLDEAQRHDREQPSHTGNWYDKTSFRIDFTFQGQPDSYEGRQDFGDGDGSLIEHIQSYHEYYAQDESWKNYVLHNDGPEAWEADKAHREMLLTEFVPYMKLHCNLSHMEQEARRPLQSGETLTPEETAYFNAVLGYVQECRPLLNQGQYQLPEPPKLSDFDQSLQGYKEQVQAEIAQEAADAGMTVEEYAAAGYEAPEPQEAATAAPLTDLQKKAVEIAERYKNLPLQDKIGIIAQAFGCTTGKIETSPCTGKWRGTSDISIKFDSGASLFIGNHLTPKAKTAKVQNECVNSALTQYNPEIVSAAKETAIAALVKREAKDNAIAAQKGLKPYTLLNVEFNDGADDKNGGYLGWYYVTLAVDGKICAHMETGLNHDIADGKVSETPTRANYFTAGALKETDVDYVFNNVGFSSASELYSLHIRDDVRERAKKTLAERENPQPVTTAPYYPINETAARRAKEANSFSDYRPGSATAEYRQYVDEAVALAERQKARVDPMYHEKIDSLLDTYARKLAANMNKGYEIAGRVPSVMIAGPANFPVRKKEKQNAAADRNMEEYREIRGLLDKIRSTGMGGISADDPQAVQKLERKLAELEKSQETMKAVNAYYRKNKTLDGCPHLSPENIEKLKASMARGYHLEGKPYPTWALSNNSAEIRRVKSRIQDLSQKMTVGYVGWEFAGGKVEANTEANRLQIFFEEKPDEATRAELKNNGFRWSPKEGAWQRQLTDNAYFAANYIKAIQPLTGARPTDLQRAHIRAEKSKPQEAPQPNIQEQTDVQEQQPQEAEPVKDTFSIYQLKGGAETRDYRFEPYDRLQAVGRFVDSQNYDLVYTAPLDDKTTLEDIYRRFNIDHPADFRGHSLSVSDIVVLNRDGTQEAHYCDSFGFKEVPEFFAPLEKQLASDALLTGEHIQTPRGRFSLTAMSREQMEAAGYGFHHQSEDGKYFIMANGTQAFAIAAQQESHIKTAEMSTEQNYNMIDGTLNNTPTMGELEARVKAGEQVSLLDVAEAAKAEAKQPRRKTPQEKQKPSIRAQLKAAKEEQAKKPPAREKSKDLEV